MLTMNTYQGALRRIIKQQMELGGMRKDELSKAAGFHKDYLNHVLSGRRDVTVKVMNAISPFLCMSTAEMHKQARQVCGIDE